MQGEGLLSTFSTGDSLLYCQQENYAQPNKELRSVELKVELRLDKSNQYTGPALHTS